MLHTGTTDMITVKVEAAGALARFGKSGIPEDVRRNLRGLIPDLTRRLAARVDANLTAGLKTRRRLQVRSAMVENSQGIIGRVSVISTSEPVMLPRWLESGTRAHAIEARNAKALYFFWERMGRNVAFRRVMHPGFAGIHYAENAFRSMESEIVNAIKQSVQLAMLREESRKGRFSR
jgi:hypothetical protein